MARFFISRPIVAMVIAIITVILGIISILGLPITQFPDITPPEVMIQATYVGADALTVEKSVATPLEQQMSGVDNMLYMYSVNGSNGDSTLRVAFDVGTEPSIDQLLSQMRYAQASPHLPTEVRNFGVSIQKSTGSPLILFTLYSPKKTYDAGFLANYAHINLADRIAREPGVGQVIVFGAGKYGMRLWVKPDLLGKLGITVNDITDAIKSQNTVNPVGQIGAEPIMKGQEFTYSVRTDGRRVSEDEFGDIIVRANSDGSVVRLRDVGRVELGTQDYSLSTYLNGLPAAVVAIYQLPGSNALDTVQRLRALMKEKEKRFPNDLEYTVSLDTTLSVTAGIKEILTTLVEAILLVTIVVFIFLQSWRATLIPLMAVPVSLVGTFIIFPLLDFSINTISLFGLVLAIGLVVDDAIVVVEAVMHHIQQGMAPKAATVKAMEEVSGPVVAIALILAAVFIPTAFFPGITGRLFQQFAVTIAASVLLSAFNALTLSPALAALLLKPKQSGPEFGERFFGWFNRVFARTTDGYVRMCGVLIRKAGRVIVFLVVVTLAAGWLGDRLPGGFIPLEDNGYFMVNVQLDPSASLQRMDDVLQKIGTILAQTPGVDDYTMIGGFNLISQAYMTYNAVIFVSLKPWEERHSAEDQFISVLEGLNHKLHQLPEAMTIAIPPPTVPGVGITAGVTFMLEDRTGQPVDFLARQTDIFLEAVKDRPEISFVFTTMIPDAPQYFAAVDRDKTLKQGIEIGDVYATLQAFMGGTFVNYFNRFGRMWQVYVQADSEYRADPEQVRQYYVRNKEGDMVPLSALVNMQAISGPEFTMRLNEYRSAQIIAIPKFGTTTGQVMDAMEEVFASTMPQEMGFDYIGMSYQEKEASKGIPPSVIFACSLVVVFLILAAQYDSWSIPFSVLLSTPIAVFGALATLTLLRLENDVYTQIGLIMLIGLGAKNAILIVEFAKTEYQRGTSLVDAALAAARLRLRPVLMTAFAFILGLLPLMVSSGAGAHARVILGATVIGGMLAATCLAIYVVPVLFYVVERLVDKRRRLAPSPTTLPSTTSYPKGES